MRVTINLPKLNMLGKCVLSATLVLSSLVGAEAQTQMRVYLNNGASVSLPVGFGWFVMDSFNYSVVGTPPTMMANYYMDNGMMLVHEVDGIDSALYVGVPPIMPDVPTVHFYNHWLTNLNSHVNSGRTQLYFKIPDEGGSPVTEYGGCWATHPNPTINDNTVLGAPTGNYLVADITNMPSGTVYFRPYATNAQGTGYGEETRLTFYYWYSAAGGVTDPDGNTYTTAIMGDDEWMTENLRTTKYANGNPIPNVIQSQWPSANAGAYAWYDDDSSNDTDYGKLYNGYAVQDARNICPTSWHVPDDYEWTQMLMRADPEFNEGGNPESFVAGGHLKEPYIYHWSSPNNDATNSTGFNGRPSNTTTIGTWWSSEKTFIRIGNNNAYQFRDDVNNLTAGTSVRCVKDQQPVFRETAIVGIVGDSVRVRAGVLSKKAHSLTQFGVCWSNSPSPTIADNVMLANPVLLHNYTLDLTGLVPGQTYYLRSFATTSVGTSYSNEVSFGYGGYTVPYISSEFAYGETDTTAIIGCNVSDDGRNPIFERGICWSTSPNPTLEDNYVANGAGLSTFYTTLTGLNASTTYYFRGYVINDIGVTYGNVDSFTTDVGLASIATGTVSNVIGTTADVEGIPLSDGGGTVSSKGICWNTTGNPTTLGNSINVGAGMATFTGTITELMADTTYYVRAYITNSSGTAYGNEITFNTLPLSLPGGGVVDYDGHVYTSVVLGTQEWTVENLRTTHYADGTPIQMGNSSVTWAVPFQTGTYCWYDWDNSYEVPYGKLYNWEAVSAPENICPTGWHAPSYDEWQTLVSYLTLNGPTFNLMLDSTSTYWQSNNENATNESGLTVLPAGSCHGGNSFGGLGEGSLFWSTTEFDYSNAKTMEVYTWPWIIGYSVIYPKDQGGSVRCVKD